MNINDIKKYQAEKDHLMRYEGTHPHNDTEIHRFKHDRKDLSRDEQQNPDEEYAPLLETGKPFVRRT